MLGSVSAISVPPLLQHALIYHSYSIATARDPLQETDIHPISSYGCSRKGASVLHGSIFKYANKEGNHMQRMNASSRSGEGNIDVSNVGSSTPIGGDGGGGEIIVQIVNELMNTEFASISRRGNSIIRPPYVRLLDPFYKATYPLNCIGTYARLISDHLESFVNIGKLIRCMSDQNIGGELGRVLDIARSDNDVYAEVRLAVREAIHIIGYHSYAIEWRDQWTYDSIDSLLEGIAAYREHNNAIANAVRETFKTLLAAGKDVTILDLGSGVGGTSNEVMDVLKEMREDGDIPSNYKDMVRFILFDVSEGQLDAAKNLLMKTHGINRVETVNGSFSSIKNSLADYKDRFDVVISGVAICHVISKDAFFKDLYSLMRPGAVISFWDPAVSQYQGHYLRAGEVDDTMLEVCSPGGDCYKLRRGELLPIDALRRLDNTEYETTAIIPSHEIDIYATEMVYLYLDMMGYTSEHIGDDKSQRLKLKLYKDIQHDALTEPGFDLLKWYQVNLTENADIPSVTMKSRTPYDLIEAVSDEREYRNAMLGAGFKHYSARRGATPGIYEKTEDALRSVIVHFYADKPASPVDN